MIIEPDIGTNIIKFGATESYATKNLGVPDKVYLNDDNASRLQYNELMMELSFDAANDASLKRIEVYHPEAELFGRRLIGRKQKDVLSFIRKHFEVAPQVSDYGHCYALKFNQGCILELQFRFGILENISVEQITVDEPELALAN